MLIKVLQITRA